MIIGIVIVKASVLIKFRFLAMRLYIYSADTHDCQ